MPNSESNLEQTNQAILAALQKLIAVVAQLRDKDTGCPWDLAQTPQTLIPYVIEEAYEVAAAIRSDNPEAIADELGDLLLQVVLQAQIAEEEGQFSLKEVAESITDKLIRRHPHVFGDLVLESPEQVKETWQKIKAAENPTHSELLSNQLQHYASRFPPLIASSKISQKAAAEGFEWESVTGVWDKFYEEFAEFKTALEQESKEQQQAELGDLLFTLVNIARWYDLDCFEALHGTNQRFIARLAKMESLADRPLSEYTLDELDALWKQAKAQLNSISIFPK